MKEIVINRPKQKRSQLKFDAILQACPIVLAEFGFKKTTTAKIALEANIGISSIYDYFSCKEAIIIAYFDSRLEKAMDQVAHEAKYSHRGPMETMQTFIRAGLDFAKEQRHMIRVMVNEFPNDLAKINLESSKKKIAQIGLDFARNNDLPVAIDNFPLMTYCLTNIIIAFQIRSVLAPDDTLEEELIAAELTKIVSLYAGL